MAREGDPVETILAVAGESEADLTVMATARRERLSRLRAWQHRRAGVAGAAGARSSPFPPRARISVA
ncbi:MAG: universal stress protein [Gemmatimonadales bacterium]